MGANTSRAQQTRRRVREQEQQLPRKADHPRKPLGGWDADAVASLVKHGRLAPPKAGEDDPTAAASDECPICFLYFPKVNATGCCRQAICTACYLQVRPQTGGAECPFCSVEDFSAEARDREESKADVPVAHKVSMDETVATVSTDERGKLEEAIRVQQIEARRRGDAPEPVPGAAPQRRVGRRPQFILRRRGAPPGEGTQALPLDDVHRLLASLGDLQHVEDLMLLEAMQASMQDETARRARAASEGSEGDAPPAPPGAARDADDADDAAFRLAVRASLRESGGAAAEEKDEEEEEEEDDDEPEEEPEDTELDESDNTDDEAEAKEGRPGFLDELPAEPADAKE